MPIFVIILMFVCGFIGIEVYEDQLEKNCNQLKVIEINNVKYKCEVLPEQKLNWTPSKAG